MEYHFSRFYPDLFSQLNCLYFHEIISTYIQGDGHGSSPGVRSRNNTEHCCVVVNLQFYKMERILKEAVPTVAWQTCASYCWTGVLELGMVLSVMHILSEPKLKDSDN